MEFFWDHLFRCEMVPEISFFLYFCFPKAVNQNKGKSPGRSNKSLFFSQLKSRYEKSLFSRDFIFSCPIMKKFLEGNIFLKI